MKKLLSALLVATLTASLMAGCATSNQTPAGGASSSAQESASAESSAPAESSTESEGGEESTEAAGGETYDIQPTQKEGTIRVALIPVTINTSYTMTINGALEHIETMGYDMELIVQAPAGNTSSIDEQGNIIENMIQQGVDAIALATESDTSMMPYLRQAAEAGIPVFFFNMTELDPNNIYYVTSIGYDQYEAGYKIGEWVANTYGSEPGKIAVLEGYPGIVNDMRMDGFKAAIEGTELEIVASQIANWTRADGQTVTESILTANPDITILYGPYDEMVLGGMVAVKDRNLMDQISIVGFGATEDAINSIRAGEMAATVDVMEYYTGYDIVDAVHQFCVEGKEVERLINRESVVYDQENVDEHDDSVFAQ